MVLLAFDNERERIKTAEEKYTIVEQRRDKDFSSSADLIPFEIALPEGIRSSI
jgi:hypothetical protein